MSDAIQVEDHQPENHPRVLEVGLKDKEVHVFVNVFSMFEQMSADGTTDGDPAVWGVILSDCVRHCARAHHQALSRMAQSHPGAPQPPPVQTIEDRIMNVFMKEMNREDAPKLTNETIEYSRDKKS